jgi:hypothetical protein
MSKYYFTDMRIIVIKNFQMCLKGASLKKYPQSIYHNLSIIKE